MNETVRSSQINDMILTQSSLNYCIPFSLSKDL